MKDPDLYFQNSKLFLLANQAKKRLQRRGWALELFAGIADSGFNHNPYVSLFEIGITLTDEGLNAAPGYGMAAVGLLFEYLEMLRSVGPSKWVYDELKSIHDTKVKFLETGDEGKYVTKSVQS